MYLRYFFFLCFETDDKTKKEKNRSTARCGQTSKKTEEKNENLTSPERAKVRTTKRNQMNHQRKTRNKLQKQNQE